MFTEEMQPITIEEKSNLERQPQEIFKASEIPNNDEVAPAAVERMVLEFAEKNNTNEIISFVVKNILNCQDDEMRATFTRMAQNIAIEKNLPISIEKMLELGSQFDNRLNGFEKDKESKDSLLASLISLDMKYDIDSELLLAVFDSIQLVEASNYDARISEKGIAITRKALSIGQEKIEYLLLHQIGHVIDNADFFQEYDEDEEEKRDFLEDLIEQLSDENFDKHSLATLSNKDRESAMEDAKANLISSWLRHKDNPGGFVLERINFLSKGYLKNIFGPKLKIARKIILTHDIDALNRLREIAESDQLEKLDKLIKNSQEIFNLISTRLRGRDLIDQIQNGKEEFGFYDNIFNEEPRYKSTYNTLGVSDQSSNNNSFAKTENSPSVSTGSGSGKQDSTTSFGEGLAVLKDFLAAFAGEISKN